MPFGGTEQGQRVVRGAVGVRRSTDPAHTDTAPEIQLEFGDTCPFSQTLHLQPFLHVALRFIWLLALCGHYFTLMWCWPGGLCQPP